jgi:hypothetical protein
LLFFVARVGLRTRLAELALGPLEKKNMIVDSWRSILISRN